MRGDGGVILTREAPNAAARAALAVDLLDRIAEACEVDG